MKWDLLPDIYPHLNELDLVETVSREIDFIIDIDGYDIDGVIEARELAIFNVFENRTKVFRFKLSKTVEELSPAELKKASFTYRTIHGLSFYPLPHEHPIFDQSDLDQILSSQFETNSIIGYKGGTIEHKLLTHLGYFRLDLEVLHCPKVRLLDHFWDVLPCLNCENHVSFCKNVEIQRYFKDDFVTAVNSARYNFRFWKSRLCHKKSSKCHCCYCKNVQEHCPSKEVKCFGIWLKKKNLGLNLEFQDVSTPILTSFCHNSLKIREFVIVNPFAESFRIDFKDCTLIEHMDTHIFRIFTGFLKTGTITITSPALGLQIYLLAWYFISEKLLTFLKNEFKINGDKVNKSLIRSQCNEKLIANGLYGGKASITFSTWTNE